MKQFLADFGSTSVKYAVYDGGEDVLFGDKLDFPPRMENPNPNITEVDLKQIDAIIDRIKALALQNGCKEMYISTQMHGYIIKGKTGFSPYVSWQDNRALDRNYATFPKEKLDYTRLGTSYKSNSPIISLYGEDLTGKEYFTLGSYVAYRLTGNNATHITDSAASGFYDAETAELVNPLNYPCAFAKSTNRIEPIGECEGIAVYAPVGDHQATYLGLGIKKGETLLNVSTATQVSTVSAVLSAEYECRPYFAGGRLCTVSGLVGGRVIRANLAVGADFSSEMVHTLAENYGKALDKMPNGRKLVIGGGAVFYFKSLLEAVAGEMNADYRISEELSAFKGLIKVAKGDF